MVDYGRNLVGNIKVKTRSSGGSFVDMGKTKSDIEKNVQEMEKLINEIKSDPRHSTDSGKMINDLKEDIRKLRLIQYDSQGKPTEESLMGIYGKDVKNTRNKHFVVTGNSSAYSALYNFSDNEIDKLYNEANKLERLSYSEKDDAKAKKLLDESIKLKDKVNSLHAIKLAKFAIGMLEKAKDVDELDEIYNDINSFLRGNPTSYLRKEFVKVHDKFKNLKQKFKVGNVNIRTKTAGGKLVNIGDTEDQIKTNINIYKDTKKRYEHRRDQYNNIIDYYQKDLDKVKKFKDGASIYIRSLNELVDRDVLAKNVMKTLEGRIKDNEKEVKFYEKAISDTDHDIKAMEDALKKFKVGNKNVVTLKSIPKRIDLDKKSDLEKAIKDIADLSKDYEHGIKVNGDDKYMHDKFVGLLKEANDEIKELKQVLAKLA